MIQENIKLQELLQKTQKNLAAFTDNAQMEAEILLSHALNKTRDYLYTHSETQISIEQQKQFFDLLNRRLKREPLSYILQQQAFWDIELHLTKEVLIPRSDTELLIEIIVNNYSQQKELQIADLGTGSGAIALSLAKQSKKWQISATDISVSALHVAKQNAKKLHIENVQFYLGNWCEALPVQLFDIIVCNPPYIAKNDPHLMQPELKYEPQLALLGGEKGLDAIIAIIDKAGNYLHEEGMLLIEHGYNQAEDVRKIFADAGFKIITTYKDLGNNDRATCGYNK